MATSINKAKKQISYPITILRKLRSLFRSPGDSLDLEVMNVSQASSSNLSAAYSFCYAYLLNNKKDPVMFSIDKNANLLKAVTRFMEKTSGLDDVLIKRDKLPRDKILFEWNEKLYCKCKEPYFGGPGAEMFSCKKCKKYFHFVCLGISCDKFLC